jgi:crotonobetainyl-CoA:carnitine CoA-transferase CaiB-like acyl-CoA transferase
MAVQALAGFLSVNDGPDGTPAVPGVPAADVAAGLTGLAAVLMALIGREKTGKGDYIDIAMFNSLLPWGAHIAGSALVGGPSPRSDNQRSLGGAAFYNVYGPPMAATSCWVAARSSSPAPCSPRWAGPI